MSTWLRSVLKQVQFEGAALVNKAQLLDSVGYVNDAAGAYRLVGDDYRQLAGANAKLFYTKFGDRVLLARERVRQAA